MPDLDLGSLGQLVAAFVQIVFGLYVGSVISKDMLHQIRQLLLPSMLTAGWLLLTALAGGWLLSAWTTWSRMTGILAASTGGLPEMTVIALASGADVQAVVLLQLLRILLVAAVLPLALLLTGTDRQRLAAIVRLIREKLAPVEEPGIQTASERFLIVLAATAGGLLLLTLGVPAGGMVGSILSVLAAAQYGYVLRFRGILPFLLLIAALAGLVVQTFAERSWVYPTAAVDPRPVLLTLLLNTASSLVLALALQRLAKWRLPVALMAAAPAGISIMTALALYFDEDVLPVVAIHGLRLLVLKTGLPLLLTFFL